MWIMWLSDKIEHDWRDLKGLESERRGNCKNFQRSWQALSAFNSCFPPRTATAVLSMSSAEMTLVAGRWRRDG